MSAKPGHNHRRQVAGRATLGRPGPVSPETTAMIRLMVDSPDPAIVKSALQRACELVEGGRAFVDPSFLVGSLHTHLRSPDSKVRRWSYKLAGRLREPSLLPLLLEAIWREAGVDEENRSWAFAAYNGYAPAPQRETLIAKLDQEYHGTSLELSARFFSLGEPEPVRTELGLGHFGKDPLARKWLSLLCGYAATEPRTIHAQFSDLDIVRSSVFDDNPENVEYSIWAEYRHPKGGYNHLLKKPQDLLEHENVRRWLLQVLTKTKGAATRHLDLVTQSMDPRYEPSSAVREGLALGMAKLNLPERRMETLDWFSAEPSLPVRLALVDHLALRARQGDNIALAVLQATYMELDPLDLLAIKIKAASEPAWLAKAHSSQMIFPPPKTGAGLGQLATSPGSSITVIGEVNMSSTRTINQVGNNNSLAGANLGQMIASSLDAIAQTKDESVGKAAPIFEQFLRSLGTQQDIDPTQREAAAQLVKEVTEAPSPEAKKSRLGMLKSVVTGLLHAPGATTEFIENSHKLIETVSNLLS